MEKRGLSKRIQALRKEKGVTQEELGRAVGVTPQAVSNWECGGTPDAEILPQIAEYFEVSIDNLYGRPNDMKGDLAQEITRELYYTEKEKRFEKAYQYCWGIQQGLFDMEPDLIEGMVRNNVIIPDSTKTNSTICFDEGISVMRLNENVHNFFMMPTPAEGMRSYLLEPEIYEYYFAILGKPGRMKTLLFLFGRKTLATSVKILAKHLDIEEEQMAEIMQEFLEMEFVQTFDSETVEGEETLYRVCEFYVHNISLVPFLVAATDLIERPLSLFRNASPTKESLL